MEGMFECPSCGNQPEDGAVEHTWGGREMLGLAASVWNEAVVDQRFLTRAQREAEREAAERYRQAGPESGQ